MKSTCSYLRLKVTYFAFEDVGCIEVMGCVKKLSQTVPAGRDLEYRTLEYWESRIPRVPGYRVPIPYSTYSIIVPRKSKTQIWDSRIRSLTVNPGDSIWDLDPCPRDQEDPTYRIWGSHPRAASGVGYEIRPVVRK